MFDVRTWERFQFLLECEHQVVSRLSDHHAFHRSTVSLGHAISLARTESEDPPTRPPPYAKAYNCQENREQSIFQGNLRRLGYPDTRPLESGSDHNLLTLFQVAFLVGLAGIGGIRTLFSGEVYLSLFMPDLYVKSCDVRIILENLNLKGPWLLSSYPFNHITPARKHNLTTLVYPLQLILRSETRYFSKGSIIADSREDAKCLMVITSGQANQLCTNIRNHTPTQGKIRKVEETFIPAGWGRNTHGLERG
jgi:hypothetical protein